MAFYLSHGSAVRHMSLVAPPPGAKQVGTLSAVANTNDFFAPGVQRADNSNARCVLRSDQRSVNLASSVTLPLALNGKFFRPRHTPYLSHGSAVRQVAIVAPPPGAKQVNTFRTVANQYGFHVMSRPQQPRPSLRSRACHPTGTQQAPNRHPTGTGHTAYCKLKRAVCSAVGAA